MYDNNVSVNKWTKLVATVDATTASERPYIQGHTFQGYIYPTSNTATVYVDDITWQ